MIDGFKKLMRKQVQESLDPFANLIKVTLPRKGWIRTIREALGMSGDVLAKKMGCTRSNITTIEQREHKGTISLNTLDQVAKALNCKLVYCLLPIETLEETLEKQARHIAKKQVRIVNSSMRLEQQGLDPKQLKQQEDQLVQELLQGNPKKIWLDDDRL